MQIIFVLSLFQARTIEAVRVDTPPVIDGKLDEACWVENPGFSDFMENWPVLCDPASESTRVVVLYDEDNLYMGCFCPYIDSNQVVAWLVPRGSIGDGDDITITIDTYNDDRNAFRFAFNPLGNQRDAYLSEGGRRIDESWDGVWYVKTSIDKYGWYAELSVPFKTLRFKPQDEQEWGLCVSRWLDNRAERVLWSDYSPEDFGRGTMIERFGTITGIRGIKPGLHMEFLPHLTQTLHMGNTSPDSTGFEDISLVPIQNGVVGLDYKWAVASNLTMDITTFPDYGQVEADPEEINLSQYETYFSERRPFFTEGASIFEFPYLDLVYTRRIGKRLPDGTEVPIYGGGKFTGKVGGTEMGFLEALTGSTEYTDWYGNQQKEPLYLYSVGRVTQDIFGRSKVGLIATSRDRLDAPYKGDHVVGADTRLRFTDDWDLVAVGARTLYSDTAGTPDSLTRSGGNILGLGVTHAGLFTYGADLFYTDSTANINAIGYIGRPGRLSGSVDFTYQNSWNDKWIRFLSTGVYPNIGKSLSDSLWSYGASTSTSATLSNNWAVWVSGSLENSYFYEDNTQRLTQNAGTGFSSNSAKIFYGGISINEWDQYIYQNGPLYFGHVVAFSPNFGLRIARNCFVSGYATLDRTFYGDWTADSLYYPQWMWTAGEGIRYTATNKLSFRLNMQQNTDAERYNQQLLATWEIAPLSYLYLASTMNLEGDPLTATPFDVHVSEMAFYAKVVYLFRI